VAVGHYYSRQMKLIPNGYGVGLADGIPITTNYLRAAPEDQQLDTSWTSYPYTALRPSVVRV
jgi:hypothetical protein